MQIWLEEHEPGFDIGRVNIRFEHDDFFKVGGYCSTVKLELPLFAHEARELIEVLKPLAAEPDAE